MKIQALMQTFWLNKLKKTYIVDLSYLFFFNVTIITIFVSTKTPFLSKILFKFNVIFIYQARAKVFNVSFS